MKVYHASFSSSTGEVWFYLLIYDMFETGNVAVGLKRNTKHKNSSLDSAFKEEMKDPPMTTTTSTSVVAKSKRTPLRTASTTTSSSTWRGQKQRRPLAAGKARTATVTTMPPSKLTLEFFDLFDFRCVDHEGRVLSPAILQALERCLLMTGPPKLIMSKNHENDLRHANPSAKGFIVERLCLVEAKLIEVARRCAGDNVTFSFIVDGGFTGQRIAYRTLTDVKTIIENLEPSNGPVGLHLIPLQWKFRHIDALQIYTDFEHTLIIGNQVTIQTPAKHSKSLEWITEACQLQTLLPDSTVVLAFVAKTTASKTISIDPDIAAQWREEKRRVVHFPVEHMVDVTAAIAMGWIDESAGIHGPKPDARVLTVKDKRKRKRT